MVRQKLTRYGMTVAEIHKVTSLQRKQAIKKKTDGLRRPIAGTTKRRPPQISRKTDDKFGLLLQSPNVSVANAREYPVPSWFTYMDNNPDVSVIIPMFKSAKVIKDLIGSWDLENDGLRVETIYVDDCCPSMSKEAVVQHWLTRSTELKHPIGRIYHSTRNQGFATSCNIGAYYAKAPHLIFLNADVVLTPQWIRPMIRLLKKEDVGIVGNLQIKQGENYIDSAGSEWHWGQQTFLHIGRNIYDHCVLKRPLSFDQAPPVLLEVQERDMVTGSCIAIRKEVFEQVGGFNPNYRIGYWEDSEICTAVREKGYKVMYQPNSRIFHKGQHSTSGPHKYCDHNKRYFINKWVKSGRLHKLLPNPPPSPKVNTILIQRAAARGDVLVAAAIAPALKKKHPGCKIIFCTSPPESDVVGDNPHIDKVITNARVLNNVDLIYNLDGAYERMPRVHILQAFADTVGVPLQDCQLFMATEVYPKLPETYIVIHAAKTDWVGRDWSSMKFSVLAKKLMEKGHNVVCVGGNDHRITCTLDLVGRTTAKQLAYVIKNAKFFIGIDSFPMHVAQTFDVPGVCFFGSIDPQYRLIKSNMAAVRNAELGCIACHHRRPPPSTVTNVCELGVTECINNVSVEHMLSEIERRL